MANVLFTNVRIFDGSGDAPYHRRGAGPGQPHRARRPHGHGVRSRRSAAPRSIDGAGAFLMPGMVEAHTHFSWNDQPSLDAIQRMPPEEHILWCAEVAEALPRHGLDLLRRRRRRQAAPRRRDPQRDQRRHHRRPALSRREPGDHGARRPRRHDPAAPAAARVRVRRDRQRRRGDAPLRAHVRQVRRRLAQDQPLGRVDHRHAERVHASSPTPRSRPASRRPRPGASASPRMRARASRSSSA